MLNLSENFARSQPHITEDVKYATDKNWGGKKKKTRWKKTGRYKIERIRDYHRRRSLAVFLYFSERKHFNFLICWDSVRMKFRSLSQIILFGICHIVCKYAQLITSSIRTSPYTYRKFVILQHTTYYIGTTYICRYLYVLCISQLIRSTGKRNQNTYVISNYLHAWLCKLTIFRIEHFSRY